MKKFLSVKGVLLVTILLVMALGSGTALAGRQASVSSQDALTRTDGASIIASSLCTTNDSEFSIYGSGFASNEIVILAVIKDADTAVIWSTGNANIAGAFDITKTLATKPPNATSDIARWPGAGLRSVEALSTRGRLATTPVLFVDDKCPGSE